MSEEVIVGKGNMKMEIGFIENLKRKYRPKSVNVTKGNIKNKGILHRSSVQESTKQEEILTTHESE